MDRQTFREELDKGLREILLTKVQDYLDQRFETYRQQVRYLSAVDRKYDDSKIIKEGLPGVFSSIQDSLSKEDQTKFVELYFSAVDQLAEQFPENISWTQQENRFLIQDEDSMLVTVGKGGKRLGRSVARTWHKAFKGVGGLFSSKKNGQWQPWTQEIPVHQFIRLHLLDFKEVEKWLYAIERMQLTLITDIEELIVDKCRGNGAAKLSDFAESLENTLNAKQSLIEQQLSAAINDMESEMDQEINKVGTIERRNAYYSDERVVRRKERFQQKLKQSRDQWLQVNNLLLERAMDVAHFSNLQADIRTQADEFRDDFQALFQSKLEQPFDKLAELLESSIQKVGQGNSTHEVKQFKDELADFVTQLVEPLQTLRDKEVFTNKVEHLFEDMLLSAGQIQQQALLLYDKKLDENPPELNQRQIEWRQVTIRVLREQFISTLDPEEHQYQDFLSGILEEILEINNIIEVNLESALAAGDEEADQEVEDPAKIAREALERIAAKVEELQNQIRDKWKGIDQAITEGEEGFSTMLLSLLHDGDLKQLQMLNAKYKVEETTKSWKTVVDSRWARVQDQLMLWWRFAGKKGKQLVSGIREFAGFTEPKIEETKRADISTYLSETDQKMKSLPYIYRRLFDFHAVADERFYVPFSETATTFKRACEQWQSSFPASFAVVGEKGSGKSTFLNRMEATELTDQSVITLSLDHSIWLEEQLVEDFARKLDTPDVHSIQDIIEEIQQRSDHAVVVLEGIQNCFVRNMNGYEAIEKLCYLISETREQIFWVVSCSRYAWRFLDKTVQVSEYFSHIATSDRLEADQIKSVIMNRHRASGYFLQFEADTDTQKSRNYRKLKDQELEAQEYLQKNYFEELTKLAEGNASVAMIFWIRSIRDFDDTCFYIQPLEVTTLEMIEELSPEVLFTLAAFVLHDTLSDNDLAKIMNLRLEESRLLLNRLHSRGLLVVSNGTYEINHLMYRQIIHVLKDRNIIHLV